MVEQSRVSEESVLAALSKVQEPELHKDLVTLNMIRDLKIEGGQVSFTMVLTTPACPLKTQIEREAKQAVASLPGVESVQVKLDANIPSDGQITRPAGAADPQCDCDRLGKGGVGKSTVAVNIAVVLAQSGARVGLLRCRYLWTEYPDHDGHQPPAPASRK